MSSIRLSQRQQEKVILQKNCPDLYTGQTIPNKRGDKSKQNISHNLKDGNSISIVDSIFHPLFSSTIEYLSQIIIIFFQRVSLSHKWWFKEWNTCA